MKRLAIVGSGDLGQLIAYHAQQDGHYEIVGFFDDYKEKGTIIKQHPVLGGLNQVVEQYEKGGYDELMVAIGYKHMAARKAIFEQLSQQVPIGKVLHSKAYIDPSCNIGKGVFILPGCILDQNVVIRDNVLLNTGCVIAHDSQVDAHTFLSPAVTVAGFVLIGECCNIGINSTIIDNLCIVPFTQTGGGTVVIKSLEQPGLYVGSPARFIR